MDLKPSNILLDANMNAKITDFGVSKMFIDKQTEVTANLVGTRGYMAPEYIMEGKVSHKLDMFSFGVILLRAIIGGMFKYAHQEAFGIITGTCCGILEK